MLRASPALSFDVGFVSWNHEGFGDLQDTHGRKPILPDGRIHIKEMLDLQSLCFWVHGSMHSHSSGHRNLIHLTLVLSSESQLI